MEILHSRKTSLGVWGQFSTSPCLEFKLEERALLRDRGKVLLPPREMGRYTLPPSYQGLLGTYLSPGRGGGGAAGESAIVESCCHAGFCCMKLMVASFLSSFPELLYLQSPPLHLPPARAAAGCDLVQSHCSWSPCVYLCLLTRLGFCSLLPQITRLSKASEIESWLLNS